MKIIPTENGNNVNIKVYNDNESNPCFTFIVEKSRLLSGCGGELAVEDYARNKIFESLLPNICQKVKIVCVSDTANSLKFKEICIPFKFENKTLVFIPAGSNIDYVPATPIFYSENDTAQVVAENLKTALESIAVDLIKDVTVNDSEVTFTYRQAGKLFTPYSSVPEIKISIITEGRDSSCGGEPKSKIFYGIDNSFSAKVSFILAQAGYTPLTLTSADKNIVCVKNNTLYSVNLYPSTTEINVAKLLLSKTNLPEKLIAPVAYDAQGSLWISYKYVAGKQIKEYEPENISVLLDAFIDAFNILDYMHKIDTVCRPDIIIAPDNCCHVNAHNGFLLTDMDNLYSNNIVMGRSVFQKVPVDFKECEVFLVKNSFKRLLSDYLNTKGLGTYSITLLSDLSAILSDNSKNTAIILTSELTNIKSKYRL